MKGELICLSDRLLLRKRFLIETINDQLKNSSQIEHSRHRSARVGLLGSGFRGESAGWVDRLLASAPSVSGELSSTVNFLYFSGGWDGTVRWHAHRNARGL